MKQESAEAIALQALAWLAGEGDLLTVFFNATGSSPDDVKSRAQDPVFLGFVLDFILMDDAWVAGFCDAEHHSYDILARARVALPGGNLPHWT
ncbi:MAG: DUF3572 domain-containing protein [Pseudomonadota bacterium]